MTTLDSIIVWGALILSGVALFINTWGITIRRLYVDRIADLLWSTLCNLILIAIMCYLIWRIRNA